MTVWELKELAEKNCKGASLTDQQRKAWQNALNGANECIGWQDPFKELFSHYKGKVETDTGHIKLVNNNELKDYWGNVKKVECTISIGMSYIVDPKRYSVSAEERTLEIIGGCSSGNLTKEDALAQTNRMLAKYQYKQKETEQTSLF